MIPINYGVAVPYQDYMYYKEGLDMIRPDRRPAVILSDKQLKHLDVIARRHESSIAEEITKAINHHIYHHTKRVQVNEINSYIP